jgi:hypothetical protein
MPLGAPAGTGRCAIGRRFGCLSTPRRSALDEARVVRDARRPSNDRSYRRFFHFEVRLMRVVRAPEPLSMRHDEKSVFLAGTVAGDWRQRVMESLRDADVTIIDPRRSDWDSSWDENADDARFRVQTEWELEAQERASIIAMYLSPESEASVSLLELGISAGRGNVVVCCLDGFWCKRLVDIVCRRHGLTTAPDLSAMIQAIKTAIAVDCRQAGA